MKQFTRFGLFLVGLLIFCHIAPADPITFTYTNINVPGSTNTVLNSINNAGQIVGYGVGGGFLYTNGTFTRLPFVPTDINNVGQIVGTEGNSLVLDTNGVITTINVPGNFAFAQQIGYTRVGINDLGQIVGTTLLGPTPHGITAFLYSNGQFSFIPARGDMDVSAAYDINNAGQIALQETSGAVSLFRSYVYLNGNYTEIDSFESSYPAGINNAGHVVGHDFDGIGTHTLSYFYADGEITSFISDPNLPLPPFYFINGLNDADQLVGIGPGGGVLATPVPEPSSLLLLTSGLVVGFLLLRKHARVIAHHSTPPLPLSDGERRAFRTRGSESEDHLACF